MNKEYKDEVHVSWTTYNELVSKLSEVANLTFYDRVPNSEFPNEFQRVLCLESTSKNVFICPPYERYIPKEVANG